MGVAWSNCACDLRVWISRGLTRRRPGRHEWQPEYGPCLAPTALSSLSARSPISMLHAGCNPERHEPPFRAKQQHSPPRGQLGSVLRSFGTAATFDILVARIQTTGTRGARLARVKAGGANACSKLTQIKRALFRLPRAGDRCPSGIQAAWLPRSSTFRRAFRSSRAQPAGPHHRARRLRARPFPAGA